MKADEWADSTYNHERAKASARRLVESCGLTPEQVRARALALSPPPTPSPWGHMRGVPLDSPTRLAWFENADAPVEVVLSTDIGQQGANDVLSPGAAPGRDDLLPDLESGLSIPVAGGSSLDPEQFKTASAKLRANRGDPRPHGQGRDSDEVYVDPNGPEAA